MLLIKVAAAEGDRQQRQRRYIIAFAAFMIVLPFLHTCMQGRAGTLFGIERFGRKKKRKKKKIEQTG